MRFDRINGLGFPEAITAAIVTLSLTFYIIAETEDPAKRTLMEKELSGSLTKKTVRIDESPSEC